MNIFVNRVYGLELQADITDRELIVILQAHDRGLVRGSKVAVLYDGERRYLDVEAIDRERTLPSVVFSGYTTPPPPPLAEAQAAELPKRPVRGVFLFGPITRLPPTQKRAFARLSCQLRRYCTLVCFCGMVSTVSKFTLD